MPYRNEIPKRHICRLPAAWQASEDYAAGTEWVCDHCDKAWVLRYSIINESFRWNLLTYSMADSDDEPEDEPQICGTPHPGAKWHCHKELGHNGSHWCKMGMGGEVMWDATWTDDGLNDVEPPPEEAWDESLVPVCGETSIPSGASCYLPADHEGKHHDVQGNYVINWTSGEYEEKSRIHGHEEAPA